MIEKISKIFEIPPEKRERRPLISKEELDKLKNKELSDSEVIEFSEHLTRALGKMKGISKTCPHFVRMKGDK